MEHMQYKSIIQVQIYLCFALMFAKYIKKLPHHNDIMYYEIRYCYCKLNMPHTHIFEQLDRIEYHIDIT